MAFEPPCQIYAGVTKNLLNENKKSVLFIWFQYHSSIKPHKQHYYINWKNMEKFIYPTSYNLPFFVAKATQVFTAIPNSVCLSHILCHIPSANHSLSCAWLALIPSANQNELKTVHLYCLIISWLALILYTIFIHDALNIFTKTIPNWTLY